MNRLSIWLLRWMMFSLGGRPFFIYNLWVCAAALLWRRLLPRRTKVIAVTGSYGKTTAKDCLAKILGDVQPTICTPWSNNGRHGLPRTLLRARPSHRFVVLEVGIDQPGQMSRSRLLVKPDIVVMLSIGVSHSRNFRSLGVTAREKAELLRNLPSDGLAILNRDDPLVAAMAENLSCRVYWFGSKPEGNARESGGSQYDLWAAEAGSTWPAGFRITVCEPGESRTIQTRLLGAHWTNSVLAAVLAARAAGVPLGSAARSLEGIEAPVARLQSNRLPSGAVLVRDEGNGSWGSIDQALAVLRESGPGRRMAVLADFYDGPSDRAERYRQIAAKARASADLVVFVGERANELAAAGRDAGIAESALRAFPFTSDCAAFLRASLRDGDVALVKGLTLEHLHRIYYAQIGEVGCRLQPCNRRLECDDCPDLDFRPAREGPPAERMMEKSDT
jgi:UDP-N-acetylmuramoyl-tripeptide--D-alanyl-D-alanine ligase